MKETFKGCKDKYGSIVKSQICVFERIDNGCGQQKYIMNQYHTKLRVMVYGFDVNHFNTEHQKLWFIYLHLTSFLV